jgi:hypothetical protein
MCRFLLAYFFLACPFAETAFGLARPQQNQAADSLDCTPQSSASDPVCTSESSLTEADRWFLMRSLAGTKLGSFFDTQRIEIYGWTEGAFTASSASGTQLPLGFNYRANDFLLQQNWLRIERTVETDGQDNSFGFLADTILPGSDYRFTLARGLMNGQNGTYGIDPVQFYAQGYFPNLGQGLDVKVGRFFGQYGVESIASISTPFVSRAYNFIYNPFTHTGLLTTLTLDENWTVQNGIVTGSDVFFDSAAEPTYIGSVKWQAPDNRSSLLLACIAGSGRFNQAENFSNPQVFDWVFTRQISSEFSYTLDALYGQQTNVPGIGTANWYGIANYWKYQWSEQLSNTARLEFFDDVDGNRTGFEGMYTALTAGLNYQPRRSVILRPEVRYDYNDQSRPFENRAELFTAAFDFIIRW